MPYVIDLVRPATSITLAEDTRRGLLADACTAILKGYDAGLADPRPIILDGEWQWLREMVAVPEDRRQKFWKKIDARVRQEAPLHFRAGVPKQLAVAFALETHGTVLQIISWCDGFCPTIAKLRSKNAPTFC